MHSTMWLWSNGTFLSLPNIRLKSNLYYTGLWTGVMENHGVLLSHLEIVKDVKKKILH